jgi:hypothetical protein
MDTKLNNRPKVCCRQTPTQSSLSLPRELNTAVFDDSRELLHPSIAQSLLHKSRVRRASGFLLTAFSNPTPHTFFQPRALIPASRPKKH